MRYDDPTHILLDDNSLDLPAGRLNQSVVGERLPAEEHVEHKGETLET